MVSNVETFFPPRPQTTEVPRPVVPAIPLTPGDRGPDIASYQGYPNWQMVEHAGYTFAFSKATEGTSYTNPYHATNWTGMAGLNLRGAYHFAQPDQNAAEDEADWFVQHLVLERDSDQVVLDLEVGRGDLHAWAIKWALRVTEKTGRRPLLYSGGPFMRVHNLDNRDCAASFLGLWLAAYQHVLPLTPQGWDLILLWQYTDQQSIPGIMGACDCSVYRPIIQLH